MKRILPIVALVLFASCVDEIADNIKKPVSGEDILVCSTGGALSRTSLSGGSVPLWQEDDEIGVFTDAGQASRFVLIDGSGKSSGTFKGKLPLSDKYHALYPYSAEAAILSSSLKFGQPRSQLVKAGDFAGSANAMLASFSSEALTPEFHNVFGLLEIRLSGNATVGKLVINDNKAGEMLWGKVSLALDGSEGTDSQTLSITDGDGRIILAMTSPVTLGETSATSFYAVLPAGSLSDGFTLEVYDKSDKLILSKTTEENQTIVRSRIRRMDVIDDVYVDPEDAAVPVPSTWSAYSNFDRTGTADETVINPESYPSNSARGEKYVGIFYFIWHGADAFNFGGRPWYNIQENLGPGNYQYRPDASNHDNQYAHHWGEPFLGYYVANDAWVTRKHAQMLVDAGVDFIALDVTNGQYYTEVVNNICSIYLDMRAHGNKTPQITFMIANRNDEKGMNILNSQIFDLHPEYAELWFKWEGKPLILADRDQVDPGLRNKYTFRRSWFIWNKSWQTGADEGDTWWGDGVDKWPWGCCYTDNENGLRAGTHNGANECSSIMPATHPISNIGRSYPVGRGIDYKSGANSYTPEPAKGIYFKTQFDAFMQLDPKVMFITGWNEWVAQCNPKGQLEFNYMCGQEMPAGSLSLFVDQYNHEYSRDIEPLRGGFGDNYYYYMVDFIRKFKGVENVPVYSKRHNIAVDGSFSDWRMVTSCYADDRDDTKHRGYNQPGGGEFWGSWNWPQVSYSNTTGRNDIRYSKVTNDGTNLYIYVAAEENIVDYSLGENGLNLFIKCGEGQNWEGFTFRVMPASPTTASLDRCNGGYNWITVDDKLPFAATGKAMELAVPLASLGITNPDSFSLDFKWVDNIDLSDSGAYGIQQCITDGDTAPNGRFCYRYKFNR